MPRPPKPRSRTTQSPNKPPVERHPYVVVGWISPGQVESRFMASMMRMFAYERKRTGIEPGFVEMISSPRIAEARSQIVDSFLTTAGEWFLMIDADMTFEPETLERMLAVAHPVNAPIIGGLCYAGGRQGVGFWPTIYEKEIKDGFPCPKPVRDFPSERVPLDQLIKVYATGAAAMLVHKSVFTRMASAYAKLRDGRPNKYPWFIEGTTAPDGGPLGEDIAFCMRCEPLDIPIHVHTGIEFGHVKTYELNTELYMKGRTDDDHDSG